VSAHNAQHMVPRAGIKILTPHLRCLVPEMNLQAVPSACWSGGAGPNCAIPSRDSTTSISTPVRR